MLIWKFAVPVEAGVPEIVYSKTPLPFAKEPGLTVKVSPETFVEVAVKPE
jgi:hypothetical protein